VGGGGGGGVCGVFETPSSERNGGRPRTGAKVMRKGADAATIKKDAAGLVEKPKATLGRGQSWGKKNGWNGRALAPERLFFNKGRTGNRKNI